MSAPVPARTWHSRSRAAEYTLNVEQTDGGDVGVEFWIGNPHDGGSVLLNRTQTGELVTDLLRRLALIGGRHAAVQAAADPSIAAQRSAQPPPGRVWTVSDSGRDALRGPESAGTGTPGGLSPADPCSPGSVDAGGAR